MMKVESHETLTQVILVKTPENSDTNLSCLDFEKKRFLLQSGEKIKKLNKKVCQKFKVLLKKLILDFVFNLLRFCCLYNLKNLGNAL